MRHRPLVWIATLTTFASVAGCSSDNSHDIVLPPAGTDIIGTFTLSIADGKTPPFIIFETPNQLWRLESDMLAIAPDGTWRETSNYRVFAQGDTLALALPLGVDTVSVPRSAVVTGTYAITNGQIHFSVLEGGTGDFDGTVTGNALIVTFREKRYTYTR